LITHLSNRDIKTDGRWALLLQAIQERLPALTFVHPNVQSIMSQHQVVFTTPHRLPPSYGVHDHSIHLVPRNIPPNVFPYRHPFSQKNEIEKNVQELLVVGVIRPSTNPYSSHVVIVLKK
jgi:hypothetical protein